MYLTQTVAVRPLPLPLVKRTVLSHIICSSPEWKLVLYDRVAKRSRNGLSSDMVLGNHPRSARTAVPPGAAAVYGGAAGTALVRGREGAAAW